METAEGYCFTALSAVACVERTLAERPTGALTPAGAFGADLALVVEGSLRYDSLEDTESGHGKAIR
jgi:hypothetical protein